MSKKNKTAGRVCGVCIAGLVSGMASGGIAMRKRAKAQGRSGGLKPIGWWYSIESARPPKWVAVGTREEAIRIGHEKNPGEGFYILPRLPASADIAEAERRLATGEDPMPEYIEAAGRAGGRTRAKAPGRSGGADAALYRASFDRPRGKGVAARFWLSPAGYDTLVKLEAEALTRAQIEDAMRRWKVGARVYRRATGESVWNLSVKPNGEIVVDVDWERVRREQRESALRGPRVGRSVGAFLGGAVVGAGAMHLISNRPGEPKGELYGVPRGRGPGHYTLYFKPDGRFYDYAGPFITKRESEEYADEQRSVARHFQNVSAAFYPTAATAGSAGEDDRTGLPRRAPEGDSAWRASGRSSGRKGRASGRERPGVLGDLVGDLGLGRMKAAQQVAEGILEQLGGRQFLVMTAAKQLLSFNEPGHGGLQFKLPRRGARAKLGIDAVRITLQTSDTYTMDFFKGMEKVRSIGSLYSDDLRRVFTEVTGLETSLGTMGRAAGKKEPKELVSWGVFPYTPDSSPSAGDPVPDTRRGYVAREVNRETGRGTHWPYSRVQAVKIYWRRHLADAYATELTYGRKKP